MIRFPRVIRDPMTRTIGGSSDIVPGYYRFVASPKATFHNRLALRGHVGAWPLLRASNRLLRYEVYVSCLRILVHANNNNNNNNNRAASSILHTMTWMRSNDCN